MVIDDKLNCKSCDVPMDLHGTCCGWTNSSVKVSSDWIIIESRHPGFGQNLNVWKSKTLNDNNWEGLYAIAKAESIEKGKKLYEALQKIEELKLQIEPKICNEDDCQFEGSCQAEWKGRVCSGK